MVLDRKPNKKNLKKRGQKMKVSKTISNYVEQKVSKKVEEKNRPIIEERGKQIEACNILRAELKTVFEKTREEFLKANEGRFPDLVELDFRRYNSDLYSGTLGINPILPDPQQYAEIRSKTTEICAIMELDGSMELLEKLLREI